MTVHTGPMEAEVQRRSLVDMGRVAFGT